MVLERFRALSPKKKRQCVLGTVLVFVAAGCAMSTPWDANASDRDNCSNNADCTQALLDCQEIPGNDTEPAIMSCVRAKMRAVDADTVDTPVHAE